LNIQQQKVEYATKKVVERKREKIISLFCENEPKGITACMKLLYVRWILLLLYL